MSYWFRLKEKWEYKRKALGRHGVHSPFVFDLIEKLRRQDKQISLRQKIETCLGPENLIQIEFPGKPGSENLSEEKIVLIQNIHLSKERKDHWIQCRKNETVTLSIDFFEYGLLFFKKDFKEKQDFVLKFL